MKRLLLPFSTLLVLGITLGACKKDKDDPKPATKSELLMGKNWKVTAVTVDPALVIGGTSFTNLYTQSAIFPDCAKDDLYRFDSGSVYKEDEGGTKCSPTDLQTRVGTWSLSTDERTLTTALPATATNGAENVSYTLLEVSENTWRSTTIERFGSTTTDYTLTITFTKQ